MAKRTVFISGANSDIGLACCRLYLKNGYKVVAHFRRVRPELDEMLAGHDEMMAVQLDFSNPNELEHYIEVNPRIFSNVDVLVNLAAELRTSRFEEMSAGELTHALNINTIAPNILIRAVVGPMVARRWGRIVNGSSIGVKFGGGNESYAYSFSKHALEFIPAVHRTWASNNVFVNAVRIGLTDTRMHQSLPDKDMKSRINMLPTKRMASPDEIAETLYWFGSDKNSFITGQIIAASGGE